jgi:hypothetical protein
MNMIMESYRIKEEILKVGYRNCNCILVKEGMHYRIYATNDITQCSISNFISQYSEEKEAKEALFSIYQFAVQQQTRTFMQELQGCILTKAEVEEKVKEYFGAEIVVEDKTYYEDDEYDTYVLILNVYEEDNPICNYMCGEFDINYAKLRHDKMYIISSEIHFNC